MRIRHFIIALALPALAACGDDGGNTLPTNLLTDTASDTSIDTTFVTDTVNETATDTVADTTPDTATDTTPDTATDTTPDTATDTTPDTADTTPDTADTTPDTADTTPDTADTADTADTSDTTVTPCGSATLAGDLIPSDSGLILDSVGDLGFGGPLADVIVFQLFADVEGSFDLASMGDAGNANYETCEQCVLVFVDVDETTNVEAAIMFQTAGTLVVAGLPSSNEVSVTLSDASFTEVTIDDTTFVSTPVAGGLCTDFAGPGTWSVPESTCEAVSLAGDLVIPNPEATNYQVNTGADLGFGTDLPDIIQVEFYADAEGTFELTGDNANYGTCIQCVRVFVDVAADTGLSTSQLFQTEGTLVVTGLPTSGDVALTLSNVNMVEVTIADDDSFTSTPVVAGACADDPGPSTLAVPPCVPACAVGAVCGSDGCGGACAAGCTGADFCALDQLSCGTGDTLTLGTTATAGAENTANRAVFTQPFDPDTDGLIFQLYGPPLPALASYDLGAGDQADFASCTVCALVTVGNVLFFQSAGTAELNAGTTSDGTAVNVTFTGLELREVTLDATTFASTEVLNGAKLTITSPVTVVTPASP
jgi:hypothetical protein